MKACKIYRNVISLLCKAIFSVFISRLPFASDRKLEVRFFEFSFFVSIFQLFQKTDKFLYQIKQLPVRIYYSSIKMIFEVQLTWRAF